VIIVIAAIGLGAWYVLKRKPDEKKKE